MKKTLIYIISVIGLFSCDLDEVPVSEVSKEPVFSTENGLELSRTRSMRFYRLHRPLTKRIICVIMRRGRWFLILYWRMPMVLNRAMAGIGKSFGTSITLSRIVRTHGYRKALG